MSRYTYICIYTYLVDGISFVEHASSGVRFTYCRTEQCWYWSTDCTVWQREDLLLVQAGHSKGQRLRNDDLARLDKLKCVKKDPFPLNACAICESKTQVLYC